MDRKMTGKRSKTWLADQLRRLVPGRDEMARNRYLAPIAHRFLSPELWRFTRRSVPRGVALGLFAAFIVPIGQIFLAAFLALPARANVPLSAAVTFVTNPLTFAFWAVVAKKVGELVLNIDEAVGVGTAGHLADDGGILAQVFELAGVTAFGFVILAVFSAAIGYVVSGAIWRVMVGRRRAKRLQEMESRLDQRLGTSEG
jgi:uncharacterized protein (DUF2062 family)